MTNRPRRAFTLIELLVVIAVIAMLIAVMLPALESARASAQVAQCSSNTRQICMATELYTHDFNSYFPAKYLGWSPNTNSGHVAWLLHGDPNVSVPPSGGGRIVNSYANLPTTATLGPEAFVMFKCPADEGPVAVHPFDPTCPTAGPGALHEYFGTSYSFNHGPYDLYSSMTFSDTSLNVSWARQGLWCKTINQVDRPAMMIMEYETSYYLIGTVWVGWCDGSWRLFHDERLPFGNMGFVDGHVKFLCAIEGPELYQNEDYILEWE